MTNSNFTKIIYFSFKLLKCRGGGKNFFIAKLKKNGL